ncbi:MAG: sigma-70 family RNA polymerase sigma factor [Devosia sp.]
MHLHDEAKLAGLMRAANGGDAAAYAEFLRIAAGLVRGLARRKLAESGVVSPEDIVQETLLAIHTKRHTWRQAEPILPWLLTIARYKVVDAYRRKGSRVFVDVDDLAELLPAPDAAPADAHDRHLEHALAGLSDGQRRVVRSIGVDGRSISETANEFGMKETAVRVAFHRGLVAIAAKFGRQS